MCTPLTLQFTRSIFDPSVNTLLRSICTFRASNSGGGWDETCGQTVAVTASPWYTGRETDSGPDVTQIQPRTSLEPHLNQPRISLEPV